MYTQQERAATISSQYVMLSSSGLVLHVFLCQHARVLDLCRWRKDKVRCYTDGRHIKRRLLSARALKDLSARLFMRMIWSSVGKVTEWRLLIASLQQPSWNVTWVTIDDFPSFTLKLNICSWLEFGVHGKTGLCHKNVLTPVSMTTLYRTVSELSDVRPGVCLWSNQRCCEVVFFVCVCVWRNTSLINHSFLCHLVTYI